MIEAFALAAVALTAFALGRFTAARALSEAQFRAGLEAIAAAGVVTAKEDRESKT